MNHSFQQAKWSPTACGVCSKAEKFHGDEVQCESCSNIGPIEFIGKIAMCASCQQRHADTPDSEKETIESVPPFSTAEQISLEQIRNQVDRLVDSSAISNTHGDTVKSIIDEAIVGNIKEYTDFFNAKIPSIMELKALIDADETITDKHYALAHALRSRIQYLARVLFQTKAAQIKMGAEVKSIQQYMSDLIPALRVRMRAEFAANTPNYTPQVIKSAPKARKATSPGDKLAENYAKIMKITVEEAKRKLSNKLKDDCTCGETPGMCKVHNG